VITVVNKFSFSPLLITVLTTLPGVSLARPVSAQVLYYKEAPDLESASGQAIVQAASSTVTPPLGLSNPWPENLKIKSAESSQLVPDLQPSQPDQPVVFHFPKTSLSQTAPANHSLVAQVSPRTPTLPQRPGSTGEPLQGTPDRVDLTPRPGGQPQIETPPQPLPPELTQADPSSVPPLTPPDSPPASSGEPRVLIAEILVTGVDEELQKIVYDAISIRPGRTTTQSELQQDVNAVFATGFFSRVSVTPEDTPLGVRITFVVQSNPVLQQVRVEGQDVLPSEEIDRIFSPLYGRTLNLRELQNAIRELNQWYQDNGYVLAQVIDTPQVSDDGIVTLQVAEGVIEDIQVRFLTRDGEPTDDEGKPIRGRTREFIITREFTLKPGDVFNRARAEADLQRVFGLGIFENVTLSLNPGQNPRQVVVIANVSERNTGSLAAGAGISSASGLFGTVSYQEQNLGGNNQKLGAEVQLGVREFLFDVSFTDPWIAGDPNRTSYTVNVFNRRSLSLIFDNGPIDVALPNGDTPRVDRLGGGISFTRPLKNGWVGSLGFQYQRVTTRDFDRRINARDALGNPLTFSQTGLDDLFALQLAFVRDRRNNPLQPTSGSILRFGTEQTLPFGSGSILFNRIRGSYSFYVPVNWLRFTDQGQGALAFNIQGGNVLGDLPPYEAFSLGGSNSVRGYEEGALGSGRSYIQATVEYRFPIFAVVGGALFLDAATDLGSGSSVLGDPAGVRGKPGSGFGYGLGVRIQTPLGPLRLDYGINDLGESRVHFGIGERF